MMSTIASLKAAILATALFSSGIGLGSISSANSLSWISTCKPKLCSLQLNTHGLERNKLLAVYTQYQLYQLYWIDWSKVK